jgi:hypothetical protein
MTRAKQRAAEWMRLGHRGLVLLRAMAGASFEAIETDHQHELGRANKLLDSLRKFGDLVGQPAAPKRNTARAQQAAARKH